SADRGPLRDHRPDGGRDPKLYPAPPRARWALGHLVLRRRGRADRRGLPRSAAPGQQPRRRLVDRGVRLKEGDRGRVRRPGGGRGDLRRMTTTLSLLDPPPDDDQRADGELLPAPAGWPAPPDRAVYHELPGEIA